MRDPRLAGALALLGVVGAAVLVVAAVRVSTSQPVYLVSQVASGLAHHPRAWMGRTVLVRGMALLLNRDECTGGHDQNGLDLVDRLGAPGTKRTALCLQVNSGVLSPDQERLFRIPLIGPALVGYQHLALGQLKTYRVVFPRHLPPFCRAWPAYSGPWPCLAVVPNSAHQ